MKHMPRQGRPIFTHRQQTLEWRWRWIALLLTTAVMSLGCSPLQTLGYLLFLNNPNLPPEFQLAQAGKDIKVAVVSTFSHNEIRPELLSLDRDLGEFLTVALRERYKANGDRVTLVPQHQVRNYLLTKQERSLDNMVELGKHLKADYVIAIEIQNDKLTLYQPDSYGQFYRGIAEVSINVFDVHKGADEALVWSDIKKWTYPETRGPQPINDCSPHMFRRAFVLRMAKDLTRCFAAYPSPTQSRGELD